MVVHGLSGMDNAMMEAGVTYNDIQTKAYERVKKALQNNPDIIIGENLSDALKEAQRWASILKDQVTNAKLEFIDDNKTRDAVACFNATINMVKATFGEEKMTESVICKAIEAGSYIGYRVIMGEASQAGWKRI